RRNPRRVGHRFSWPARLRSSPFRWLQESSRAAKTLVFSSTGFSFSLSSNLKQNRANRHACREPQSSGVQLQLAAIPLLVRGTRLEVHDDPGFPVEKSQVDHALYQFVRLAQHDWKLAMEPRRGGYASKELML